MNANWSKQRVKKVTKLVNHLNAAKVLADELELILGNGGEFGSLIGGIADELTIYLDTQAAAQ
jgi:hypothetical protein